MHHHNCGEEDVYSLHNGGWNNLRLGIISIEVQRCEDAYQHRRHECSIILQRCVSEAFKDARAYFECNTLHANLRLEQVNDDGLDIWQLLRG